MITPTPDYFVSGTLQTGRLVLTRERGSTASCDVLICFGSLINNEDSSFDVVFPA